MADGRYVGKNWKCYNSPTDGPVGTKLGWLHQHVYRKTVSLALVVTANRAGNILVLGGLEIRNIHDFDETWMTLCHCSTRKLNLVEKQQILIQKTLEVLSLLRPIVQ